MNYGKIIFFCYDNIDLLEKWLGGIGLLENVERGV